MLDARFSHLHFCQSLPTPQRGLSAIAHLLVLSNIGFYAIYNTQFLCLYINKSKRATPILT